MTGFDGLSWVKAEQRAALVSAFDPFWKEYPKVRGSRFEAEKAFAAAVKTWSLAEWQNVSRMFVDAVRAAKASPDWTKDGGRYIPAASVWLNGHRWEEADGIPAANQVDELKDIRERGAALAKNALKRAVAAPEASTGSGGGVAATDASWVRSGASGAISGKAAVHGN